MSEFGPAFKAYVTASEDERQAQLDALLAICKREGIRSVRVVEAHVSYPTPPDGSQVLMRNDGHSRRCGMRYDHGCSCPTGRRYRVEKAIADARDKTKHWPEDER